MWHSLFFDKYAGDHQYSNTLTKKVTIDSLSKKNGYSILEGSSAIKAYNSLPKIPLKLPEVNKNFYKVKFYKRVELNKIITAYTVVMININNIKKNLKEKKEIPDYNFMSILFKYHYFYNKASKTDELFSSMISSGLNEKSIIDGNIFKLIKKVLEANEYSSGEDMIDDPEDITAKLYDYQKCSIYWMLQKEKQKKTIYYSTSKELVLGNNLFFDFNKNRFNFEDTRKKLTFNGGAIIDEVGLGKTLQITTLALLNQKQVIHQTIPGSNKFHSRATLILCPNHLCGQWKRELTKMIKKDYNPSIISILTKRHFDKYTYDDLLDADFVIVSFTFLNNKVFCNKWVQQLKTSIKNYNRSSVFNHNDVKKLFDKMGQTLLNDPIESLKKVGTLLPLINWHRFVIDEFHEAYTNDKYIYVKNLIPHISSNFKWIVTGTPFNNDENLYHMVNYLTNYENKEGKQVLTSPDMLHYLGSDCFRRNTKTSVEEEFKLPPFTEKIHWLQFTPTERAMYNAYLANPSNNKYSVYLRQLCCHPNLAEETKNALASCKTLKDIEKMMLVHYRTIAKKGRNIVMKLKTKSLSLKKNIKEREQERDISKLKSKLEKRDMDVENMSPENLANQFIIEYSREYKYIFDDEEDTSDYDEADRELEPTEEDIEKQKEKEKQLALEKAEKAEIAKTLNEYDEVGEEDDINEILNITVDDIETIPSISSLKESLKRITDRYILEKNLYQGHKTTYVFFNNVINRLKNTMNKTTVIKETEIIDENMNAIDFLNAGLSDSDESSEESEEESEEESGEESGENNNNTSNIDRSNTKEEEDVCGICLEEMVNGNVGVTKCGHIFCYSCLKETYEASKKLTRGKYAKCPICRQNITENSIYQLSCTIKKEKPTDQIELDKDELIDEVGTKLAELICFLRTNTEHTIIFSQWEDLLNKIGKILKTHGIKNIFCKGNVYQKDKAIREFNTNDKIKVIMLSSGSAAAGTNLTKAERVILLDPVYGKYEHRTATEGQAIGRAHRLGQTKELTVCRFVVRDTIEEEIYKKNIEEDKKYPEFEGRKIVEIN